MATPVGDSVPLSGNPVIDGLVQGGSWSTGPSGTLTYSLWDSDYGAWTSFGEKVMDRAFEQFEKVANISFVEVAPQLKGTANGIVDDGFLNNNSDISILPTGNQLHILLSAEGLAFFPDPEFCNDFLASEGVTRYFYPTIEGDIFLDNFSIVFDHVNAGGFGLLVILHEIDHSLGLKHSHDDGGNNKSNFIELGLESYDNNFWTIMSYNEISSSIN